MNSSFSIIIPVYHEAAIIQPLIPILIGLADAENVEIIVVDGDPDGGTIRVVNDTRITTLVAGKGRAIQMNHGAAAARGDILVFLHADTLLPPCGLRFIREALENTIPVGGAFDLGIRSGKRAYRVIEKMVYYRTRLTKIPYGDQAIFIYRDLFLKIKGYKQIPIMEDIDLMRRLKVDGYRITIIPHPVQTSPRRWEREGIVRCTLRNWILATLYLLGVSPAELAKYYR